MQTYTYNELKEAAVIYFVRDQLEKTKTKIELIKLAENDNYNNILDTLLEPFEYLGDIDAELKNINGVFRYLNTDYCVTSKKDWQNFIDEIIDNFYKTFDIESISNNNIVYYYLPKKLNCINC